MTLNPTYPEPGVYYDVPAPTYHAAAGLSNSALSSFVRSPKQYRAALSAPQQPTAAMLWGTAFHAAFLEQRQSYVVRPEGLDARTKEGKAWLAAQAPGAHVMSSADHSELTAAINAARMHPHFREVRMGRPEVSCFAQDNDWQIGLKCRFDSLHLEEGRAVALDVKTTSDASTRAFAKDMFARRYHIQAALYRRVLRLLGYDGEFSWTFVIVQRGDVPLINIRWLKEEAMDLGEETLEWDVRDYKRCRQADVWPDFLDQDEHVGPIDIPEWAYGDKDNLTGMTQTTAA